jgi:uncharacterized protein
MTQGDPIPPPPSDPNPGAGLPPNPTSFGGAPPAAPLGTTPVPYESAAGPVETNPEARTWGMVAHLSSLVGLFIPFGNFAGPLIVWLMKKDQMPFVDDQGKESVNFQITVTIAALVAGLTICIGIGFVLLPIVAVAAIVMAIIAGIKANEGVRYRYPFTLRLIK